MGITARTKPGRRKPAQRKPRPGTMKRAAQLIKRLEHAVPLYVAYLVLLVRLLVALTVQLHLDPTPQPAHSAEIARGSDARRLAVTNAVRLSPGPTTPAPTPDHPSGLPEAA